jgi:hypothetical protein
MCVAIVTSSVGSVSRRCNYLDAVVRSFQTRENGNRAGRGGRGEIGNELAAHQAHTNSPRRQVTLLASLSRLGSLLALTVLPTIARHTGSYQDHSTASHRPLLELFRM